MSFLSLYRKYRPENFNDLIGQEQVKKTLKNALKNDRVAHAYLFAGPRGTGKTSTAKVFAKSLNCASPSSDFEPCGECNSCQRIENGNSLDVIEIDAASNRGIDEIRELREKVKFYPGEGKYKVYIIDEVHMLTKGAFNALLKTLEEPPDSVVFILATTEPHKVITTIMSRCQRFDFTLLTLNNLKKRMKYIAENEGYDIDNKALDILARSARGGMRDAISLLDQAISFGDGNLSSDEVTAMLGRIDKSDLKEFLLCLSKNESQKALELLNKQLETGVGVERISDELIEYCRELLLIKECGIDSGILEYSHSYLEEIASVAENLSTKKITNIIDEFASLKEKLRSSARPRLQLEISIIKLSSRGGGSNSLEARLSELEFKINNLLNEQTKLTAENKLVSNSKSVPENNIQKDKDIKSAESMKSKDKTVKEDNKNLDEDNKKQKTKKEAAEKMKVNKTQTASEPTKKEELVDLQLIKDNWARVLNEIRQLDISVQALLREASPAEVKGEKVIIAFPEDKKFHYKGAASNKALLERVLRNILNETVEIEFQLGLKKKELSDQIVQNKPDNFSKNTKNKEKDHLDTDNLEKVEKKKEDEDNHSKNIKVNEKTEDLKQGANELTSKNKKEVDDLDIEDLARIFSGDIIEVDQSILENRGGK